MVEPISLCLINRNGAHHLPRTLQAVEDQDWPFAEMIIVDDASSDASRPLIEKLAPRARLIALDRQGGPARARNRGYLACRHDLALFIDNDVRLRVGTVRLLFEDLMAAPNRLLVTPRTLYEDRQQVIQYDSADCHFLGLMVMRHADQNVSAVSSERASTSSVCTGCFLIQRRLWGAFPPFDEEFGFNLEDHDFGVRAQLLGHELRVQPQATILHGDGSSGLSYRPGREPSSQRLFYLLRNRWLVIAKSFQWRTILMLLPALCLFEVAQLAFLILRGEAGNYVRAVRSLIAGRRSIRENRAELQSLRIRSDRDFLVAGRLPLTQWVQSGVLARMSVCTLDATINAYWRLVRRWL